MKQLLVIRHCESDDGNFLTQTGREQVEKLVAVFRTTFMAGTRFKFLSSKQGRAMRTIVPLAKSAGVDELDIDYHDCLFSNDKTDVNAALAAVYEVLQSLEDKVDVVVVVTHLEIAETLPKHYADMALGLRVKKCIMGRGAAALLDMKGQVTLWN